jgi:hypothetical protein
MASLIKLSLATLLLSGCSLLSVSHFDANEQAQIVTIVQMSQNKSLCEDVTKASNISSQIAHTTEWLRLYSQDTPNNGPMQTMTKQLDDSAQEFRDRYSRLPVPTRLYCEIKLNNINTMANTMREVSARRPR